MGSWISIRAVRTAIASSFCIALPLGSILAIDVDGPDDCARDLIDYGDAPECIAPYPVAFLAQFPTCTGTCGTGTQTSTAACPPISTPPGPTGFVKHVQFGPGMPENFWLGCYPDPAGAGLFGIDSELDGKTGTPPSGTSTCAAGVTTECVESAFGMMFDQDECWLDGSDTGIPGPPITLVTCKTTSIPLSVANCGTVDVDAHLNILIDYDADGDWNDVLECPAIGPCAPEWAVFNAPIRIPPGCTMIGSPPFVVGPRPGPSWMRVTLTLDPVPPDFPWAGSMSVPGGEFLGGETEDYPLQIDEAVPTEGASWGEIKSRFR